jgi:hypothetical protein
MINSIMIIIKIYLSLSRFRISSLYKIRLIIIDSITNLIIILVLPLINNYNLNVVYTHQNTELLGNFLVLIVEINIAQHFYLLIKNYFHKS